MVRGVVFLSAFVGCQWLSGVPSERRLKPLLEELRAADSYATIPVKDLDGIRQFSRLDPETFELLKQWCGRPLRAQVELQSNGINSQGLGGDVASSLVKQRRDPNGFAVLRKRKPAKSAPTELDPTFMLMGIGRR